MRPRPIFENTDVPLVDLCAAKSPRRAFLLFLRARTDTVQPLVKREFPINQKRSSSRQGQQRKADGVLPSWKTILGNLFGIDPRSLAAFRVAMGALLLLDLAIRATDLNVMYTDDGMFSRVEICRRATTVWNWSFHFGSGSWGYQAVLLGIAAALGLMLLTGFETRLATIGSWLMLISIHHRVPAILSGADILLRMLLLWGMFLPLERVWSVDRWLEKLRSNVPTQGGAERVLSIASVAILLQMALMYLFSAIFKSNTQWFRGDVIAGSLAHDFYASPPAAY